MAAIKELKVGDVLPPKQILLDGHLYNRDNSLYCVRPSCEGCQYDSRCTRDETVIKIGQGINIREAFRARPGFKWACIDFAGIELRVAALLSGEPVWVKAFQEDRDLHQEMGKVMFQTETPDKAQRDIAKMGNFGNLYLAGVDTFWHLTTLSYLDAAKAWKAWWRAVPTYERWTLSQEAYYKEHGHVWTFFRRKREMKDMIARAEAGGGKKGKSSKKAGHGFCKRTAVNSPVQGTSADLVKLAMTRVDDFIYKQGLANDVKMFLTVHDELDFEIRDTPALYEILRDIGRQMTLTPKGKTLPTIPNWTIPLKVDIEVGDNWGNLASLDDVDPATKDRPRAADAVVQRDRVTLVVSGATTDDTKALHLAIFRAANVTGFVKLPLYLKMGDRVYTSKALDKVSEVHLRLFIQGIPGVQVL